MIPNFALLQRLEQSFKAALGATREHLVQSAFDVYISASSEAHMSCAVPMQTHVQIQDYPRDIEEMIKLFVQRHKQPRLEYFHELHPFLKPALEGAGFVQEMAAPIMVLRKEDLTRQERAAPGTYHVLGDKDEVLKTFLKRQSLAFGGLGDENSLSWLASLKQGLQEKSVCGAYLEHQGEMVTGAIIQGAADGELAGVWTLPSKQKQGLGYALCQQLLSDYFATTQSLCWLSAAQDAQRLYAKLGFKVVGTQLNMVLPAVARHTQSQGLN